MVLGKVATSACDKAEHDCSCRLLREVTQKVYFISILDRVFALGATDVGLCKSKFMTLKKQLMCHAENWRCALWCGT